MVPCPSYHLGTKRNVVDTDWTLREHGQYIHVRRQYPPKSYLSDAYMPSGIRMHDIHLDQYKTRYHNFTFVILSLSSSIHSVESMCSSQSSFLPRTLSIDNSVSSRDLAGALHVDVERRAYYHNKHKRLATKSNESLQYRIRHQRYFTTSKILLVYLAEYAP